MTFRDLDLEPALLESIQQLGFETPTEIQTRCYAPATAEKNIVGISQTGTGKTLAFLLPVVNRIYKENIETPTCLILAPTRELCVQISEELQRLTRIRPLRIATVYGGEGYARQEKELDSKPHFIVATPGRLIDFMKQKRVPVDSIRVLVLDEADRMFDMGFIRDIRYVMRHIPENSQVMLFTATMSYYVMRLVTDFMGEPEEIKIDTDRVEVEKIEQSLYHLGLEEKMPYLVNLIRDIEGIKAIVFTNSRHRVQDIVRALGRYGVHATGISSLLDQKKRIHLLKSFKLGKYNVLVATDVASRGLDIDDITHVFNYDLPQDPESYVHRIGRTARAGKEGTAISFCSEMDYECLPRIEILLEHKIPVVSMDPQKLKFPPPSPITVPEEERLTESSGRGRHSGEVRSHSPHSHGKKESDDRNRRRRKGRDGSRPGSRPEAAGHVKEAQPSRDLRDSREGAKKEHKTDKRRDHRGSGRGEDQTVKQPGRQGQPAHKQETGKSRRRRRGGRRRQDERSAQAKTPQKKSLLQRILGIFRKS